MDASSQKYAKASLSDFPCRDPLALGSMQMLLTLFHPRLPNQQPIFLVTSASTSPCTPFIVLVIHNKGFPAKKEGRKGGKVSHESPLPLVHMYTHGDMCYEFPPS